MIPRECKRLAEVDFPIAEVSRHAVGEDRSRNGHPHTLHLWWARRPLASSRAVLMALLLPDPCDPHCPPAFSKEARRVLLRMAGRPSGWTGEIETDEGLRRIILKFIADFANWDQSAKKSYVDTAKALVRAAHGDQAPLVVDPFAGGGSIPLEALRLGCETFASDLNPVACLILKVMLEDIPRYGPRLAEELRMAGEDVRRKIQRELADLYPPEPDGTTPLAYLWARTVRCESPRCGAEIPLMQSFWLCNKKKRKRALRLSVERPDGLPPRVVFEVFEPTAAGEVHPGTVSYAKATCPCCRTVLPPERVRSQLGAGRGGADVIFNEEGARIGGARMMAVVTFRPGERGWRHYRLPTDADYAAVRKTQTRVDRLLGEWEAGGSRGLCPVPDEPLPLMSGTFNVPLYGINAWGDLFTARQKAALIGISTLVGESDSPVTARLLALAMGKLLRHSNVLAKWHRGSQTVAGAFGMQALSMSWDYPEMYPLVPFAGGLSEVFDKVAEASLSSVAVKGQGQAENVDAASHSLPDQTCAVWFTDPPYYFAVPYADLSDFFFVWMKRTLPDHPLFGRIHQEGQSGLTPKEQELCEMARWDPVRYGHKDHHFYEDGMAAAFAEGCRILHKDGVGSVVFAHKTTEGWEALLSGMIRGGWTITGSWPIATERKARLRA